MARIAVAGFHHETNCFVAAKTDFAYFTAHRDRPPFRHLGVEPKDQKILVLESTCHFRAEFEPIAAKVIVVISPGGYLADPALYPYRRLRPGVRLRPLGPAVY